MLAVQRWLGCLILPLRSYIPGVKGANLLMAGIFGGLLIPRLAHGLGTP